MKSVLILPDRDIVLLQLSALKGASNHEFEVKPSAKVKKSFNVGANPKFFEFLKLGQP